MIGATLPTQASLAGQRIVLVGSTSWYLYKFRQGTIKALRERGAHVICIAPRDEASSKLTEKLGAEYRPWPLDLNSANPLKELATLITIFITLARLRPDYTFNFAAKPNIYAGLACRTLRLSYANNVAGLGMVIESRELLARIMRALYGVSNRGAARLFTQNPDDLAFMRSHGLIGNTPVTELAGSGVDLTRFAAQDLPPLPLTFVMISRLQADKGVREFVAAAQVLRTRRPEIRFVLIGPTEYTNRSAIPEDELAGWRAEGIVEIPGATDDVRPWLARAHAVVLPSHGGEGTPRILLEAAACGRPAITSDVPGCRDAVINGQTGFIHAPQDEAALVHALERLAALSPEALADMGRAARARAEQYFSEDLVVGAYLDCLNDETT